MEYMHEKIKNQSVAGLSILKNVAQWSSNTRH